MGYSELINNALGFMREFYQQEVPNTYVYHSFQHTLDVLDNSILIAKKMGLSESDTELIAIAAVFHDSGHSNGHHNHEQRSVKNAMSYLSNIDMTDDKKNIISSAIMSTKVPQDPSTSFAAVLCDADLMYLASDNFLETAHLLLKEWRLTGRSHISTKKFYEMSIDFLDKHRFHTAYGKLELEERKSKNRSKLHFQLKNL